MTFFEPVAPRHDEWRRLHPLSPLLRAGRAVAVLVAVSLDGATELVLEREIGTILSVLAGVLALAALYSWLAWRSTVYRMGDELELRTGIVFRSHRRVPIMRIESVDVARPIIPRALGLAQVRVESVSQGKTEVRLSYLAEDEAAAVRDELAARQRPAAAPTEGTSPTSPTAVAVGRPIVQVPTGELLLAVVGARVAVPVALTVVVTVIVAVFDAATALGVLLSGALASAVMVIAGLTEAEKLYGFTLGEADDGMHIRRGLLNELHQRVAPGRIQSVAIVEPWLWRPFDRVQVVVDIAGYRGGEREQQRATAVLLPLAPPDVARYVLARIVPGLSLDTAQFAHPPPAARLRSPVRWRRYGVAWSDQHAIVRRGVLRRHTEIVPHHKVQSARITDGPWQRSLGLATLHLDTAGTHIRASAPHISRAEAERLAWASRAAAP